MMPAGAAAADANAALALKYESTNAHFVREILHLPLVDENKRHSAVTYPGFLIQ